MSNEREAQVKPMQPMVYQIRLGAHLGQQWLPWFGDATISLEDDGSTVITCTVVDQAALHGYLKKVRDLGVPLISVNRMGTGDS